MQRIWDVFLTISLALLLLLLPFSLIPPRQPAKHSPSSFLDGTHIAHVNRRMLRDESSLSSSSSSSKSYAVVFDGGSTGSRVHVFCFNGSNSLLPVDDDIEFYKAVKPGLSSYASNPQEAASSLEPLLEAAESAVPTAYHSSTPLRLGATAGVRALESNVSASIMEAVRDMFENETSFKYEADWVTVLSGSEEGEYLWVAINYLLGNLGNEYSNTVGVVDLGGGSVQMAYAISKTVATESPTSSDGTYLYVKELSLQGSQYDLYVYSYSNYGLLAARAEILEAVGGLDNPCILQGYDGIYNYSGTVYNVSGSDSGSNFTYCRAGALEALNVNESCAYGNCTFGGVWSGSGGAGQKNLYVASYFYDKAAEVGFIDSNETSAVVKPLAFKEAAEKACEMTLEAANQTYTSVDEDDLPYLCMDLVYQYTLLTDGFGLDPEQNITLVTAVEYGNYSVDAAWPLGAAIDVLSSSSSSSLLLSSQ